MQMRNENWERSPFRGSTVKNLTNRIVLNESGTDYGKYVARFDGSIDVFGIDGLRDRVLKTEKELKQLERLGIKSVPHEYVMTEKGMVKICSYIQDGVPVFRAPDSEIDQITKGLLQYYKQKFDDETCYMDDIADPRQYLYGRVNGEEKHVYLADIEGQLNGEPYSSIPGLNQQMKELSFCNTLADFRRGFIRISKNTELRKMFANLVTDIGGKAVYPATRNAFIKISQIV